MSEFEPNWVSKPGDTILDILHERKMSVDDLKVAVWWPTIQDVIDAKEPICEELALRFEKVLGTPKNFWLNREKQYRMGCKRLGIRICE